MATCIKCGDALSVEDVATYKAENELGGMNVILADTAVRQSCPKCGTSKVVIPNLPGLLAAVAVCRATEPSKLYGHEIKFLRKAMELNAKEFADLLEVSQETVSRWENGKAPIGPANEKLLRVLVGVKLGHLAPGIPFKPDQISSMRIQSARNAQAKIPPIILCRIPMLDEDARETEVWRGKRKVG